MIMLEEKKSNQQVCFVTLFPVCVISVLHTFGFCICSVRINSFCQVGKCIYAFLRA